MAGLPLPWRGYVAAAVEAHGWKSLRPFEWDGARLRWPQRTWQGVVPVSVGELDGRVEVSWPSALAREGGDEIVRAVRRSFFLDVDFQAFHALCRKHRDTVPIANAGLGPILRSPTAFEDAVKTLLTTNVTWPLTKRMAQALCERFGGPEAAFPTPERLLAASAAELRAAGLGYRATYVRELARRVAEGELDLEALERSKDPRLILRSIRGFGPYAVAHMAMLLGSFDEIPVDSWALTLARRYLVRGKREATKADIERHFRRFGRWRALVFRLYRWDQAEARDW